jgi:hypothetical protein
MRRHRILAALLAAAAVVTVSCQTGVTMWASCTPAADGNTTGTDGTYVLVCKDGTWEPIMTVDEYVRMSRGERVTLAPLPTRPTSTTTTTTSTTSTTVDPYTPPLCWDSPFGGNKDFALTGAKNTVGNGYVANSNDGSCTGGAFTGPWTVVQAADEPAALVLCTSLGAVSGGFDVFDAGNLWPAAPSDAWVC